MKEKSNTIPPSELLPPKGRGLLAKIISVKNQINPFQ